MTNSKSARPAPRQPLEAGQLWRMADGNLQVSMVGKLLVHYKYGKSDAVRIPHSCNSIKTVEEFLKTKKAVLASPESLLPSKKKSPTLTASRLPMRPPAAAVHD